ncbi:DUF6442 family protein [Eubacterium sp.]
MKLQRKLCKILCEVITVHKKEILEKAQKESDDEGLQNARNKGRAWGVVAFTAVYVIITIFNFVKDNPNNIPSLFFMAYIAAESIPEFIFTKKKIFLFTSICAGIAAILNLIQYMTGA